MKLDTDKIGLAAIFKEWQIPVIEELFERPLKSVDAWMLLKEKKTRAEKREHGTVSRASAINFLNKLVNLDLLNYNLVPGKGGHHRIYKMVLTREEFAHRIISKFVNKLHESFPEESETFPWSEEG